MKTFALLVMLTMNCLAQGNKPVFNEDQSRLLINDKVFLDSQKDGFMGLKSLLYAPDGKRFLVLACGFECSDNIGFLFNADGTKKRRINVPWDWILDDKVEWSADSQFLYYYRINSSAADPPRGAPPEGWVQVNVRTGAKALATARRLKAGVNYGVFRLRENDVLNMRRAPGLQAEVVGKIPYDGKGVQFAGETKAVGKTIWAKVKFGESTGWVNQSYLYEVQP